MVIFFGDSLTSGENNNFISYVQKLSVSHYINCAVSGTTIGDYSLYPVRHNNFLELLYKNEEQVKKADKIFLSYGANDIASLAVGYCSIQDIKISLNKCIDFIHQVNPNCSIKYIFLSSIKSVLYKLGKFQKEYLDEYLGFSVEDFQQKWEQGWMELYFYLNHKFKSDILFMIRQGDFFEKHLDSDNLHPTDEGYGIIAKNLIEQGINK